MEEWKKQESYNYNYFHNIRERETIYEFCEVLSQYLEKEKIKNIIFLDRSARPAWIGVNEYWKMYFKQEDKPKMYFINPHAFNIDEELKGESKKSADSHEKVTAENLRECFPKAFPDLIKNNDAPLVVFDTCAHTGETISLVLIILKQLGFSDVRVVTANKPDEKSGIKSEVIMGKVHLDSCYPFGSSSLVNKTADIISKPKKLPVINREKGLEIREEIKHIIRDKGK